MEADGLEPPPTDCRRSACLASLTRPLAGAGRVGRKRAASEFFLGWLKRAALLLRWLLVRGLSVQLCVFVGLLKRAALCFSRLGAVQASVGCCCAGVVVARLVLLS